MVTCIGWEEIERHNSQDDCWVVLHEKVYDVTGYLDDHAGGVAEILYRGGQDITKDYYEAGHSNVSIQGLKSLFIGVLNTTGNLSSDKNSAEFDFVERQVKEAILDTSCLAENWQQMYLSIPLQGSTEGDMLQLPHPGQVFVFRKRIDENNCISRLYTPVSWNKEFITFAIKLYKDGKMSQHLAKLTDGDMLELRGPLGFEIPNMLPNIVFTPYLDIHHDRIDAVAMIAAGSGITPMIPLIKQFDEAKIPMSLLVYARRFEELMCMNDIISAKEKAGKQLRLIYGLSETSDDKECAPLEEQTDSIVKGRAKREHLDCLSNVDLSAPELKGHRLFVVCGSPNFCRFLHQLLRHHFLILDHEIELLGV